MIVVDSSALAKYLLREEGWEGVEEILRSREALSLELAVKEVLNTVWKHAVLLGNITENVAFEKYRALKMLLENEVIVLEPQDRYLDEALRIALGHSITFYDALFIAQARVRKATLLTSDGSQSSVAEGLGVPVIYIP